MKLTMMEAKTILVSEHGATLMSDDLAAIAAGLNERQLSTGLGNLINWDPVKRVCEPTALGLKEARDRVRSHMQARRNLDFSIV